MTPEKQRIAIAEACPERIQFFPPFGEYGTGDWMWTKEGFAWTGCVKNDPLADLHAMHEAEATLTETQRGDWFWRMQDILGISESVFMFCHASAAQRAEAFLRTIGKWEEDA